MPLPARAIIAALAGALVPLSFSPVNIWLFALVSVALLFLLLRNASVRESAWLGWAYGMGLFGLGASWVYVSINVYGNATPILAALLTLLFVAGLALCFALQCWVFKKYFARNFAVLTFSACWVLAEWFRGWFLTGFPWLYLGYAHTNSLFSGVAPLFGVMGISFVIALSGAIFGDLYRRYRELGTGYRLVQTHIPTFLLVLWGCCSYSGKINWVEERTGESVQIGIVQANIDQNLKFNRNALADNLAAYEILSDPLWEQDVILWPETAIPLLYDQAESVLGFYEDIARLNEATLITGILAREDNNIYNSITSIGNGSGLYYKQKLVPFGEYVPLRAVFSTLLTLFDLPMSSLVPGPANQPLLEANGLMVAPFICYEVVYPDFVRKQARTADYLVTISNDTWFGASWGPLQHLQMAAMRALENGRYMVRATNNGVSAIINEKGIILSQTPQFEAATLVGEVKLFTGRTPFNRFGSWPVLVLSLLILAPGLLTRWRKRLSK